MHPLFEYLKRRHPENIENNKKQSIPDIGV